MSVGGLLIAFVLTIAVIALIGAPLLRRPGVSADSETVRRREKYGALYDRALRNVRDLDEDHALGKIDPDLYTADRAVWLERGVWALKMLDKVERQASDVPPAPPMTDADMDAAIDAAIARARASAAVSPDDDTRTP